MPISFLPTELLQLIFRTVRDDTLALNDENMSWMSLACVSRTWRDTLHGDPFLWTHLAFTDATPFHIVESALDRSQQVGSVHLKFTAGSSESSGTWGWLAHLSTGHPLSTYTLPEKVHFLWFRWRKGVRDTVFDGLEGLRADGVVSLVLKEEEDIEDFARDDDRDGSESGSVSGHKAEDEPESELDPETGSADDENALERDSDDEESPRWPPQGHEDTDSESTDFGVDGHWNGSESDYASSDDESSKASIPDSMSGLGDDSSTYLDSESDGGKFLSELDDDSDEATDAGAGDDYDTDSDDLDDSANDIDQTDSDAPNPDEDEGDDNAVVPVRVLRLPQPPRILQLPDFPSLINLAATSVLLSIPLQVKRQLTDMTLMDTSWYTEEFEKAGVVQSWLLDMLEGCVQLGALRLCYPLAVEGHNPEQRTVALPNLKFLHVEDVLGGIQDTLRFLRTSPEVPTRVDLHTLFSVQHWQPDIDGVFVGNLPTDLARPYFADTVTLDLQVDNDFVLQGRTRAPGFRQWDMKGTLSSEWESWSDNDWNRLLYHAILDLSHPRIVAAANVTTLAIHIAPQHRTREVDWARLVFGLPRVSKFVLGGDEAVQTFLGRTPNFSYWPDLTELHFCLMIHRAWNVTAGVDSLSKQLWSSPHSWEPRLGVKVVLRLPGFYAPLTLVNPPPAEFAPCDMYSELEELSGEHGGRLQIVGCRCSICHQPAVLVDVTYASV